MNINRRTPTTAPSHSKGTKWTAATSNSGRRSIITPRSRRRGCRTRDFHLTTDWDTTNRWIRTGTGRIVHHRWRIWQERQTDTVRTGTKRQRRRCIRRASCRQRRRRQVGFRGVLLWNRRNRCLIICTLSSTWCSMECRTNSISCIQWTTCSIKRRCRRCTSKPCMRSSHRRNSPHLTPTHRYPVHFIPGCEVNLVSFSIVL